MTTLFKTLLTPGVGLLTFLVAASHGLAVESVLYSELKQDLKQADVVLLGEIHDNPLHHLVSTPE